MTRVALGLLLSVATVAVAGGAEVLPRGSPRQADRTVAWYVAHPAALKTVTLICRNDPGHGMGNPDCANAAAARMDVALREDQRHLDMTPPTDPEYWRRHPSELRTETIVCARHPDFTCAAARVAAAGMSRR